MTEIHRSSLTGESPLDSCEQPLIACTDLVLLDLDGVVYRGPHAVAHAAESLATARERGVSLHYVTNNAGRPPQDVADHLRDLGIPTLENEVTTAAQAAAVLIAADYPAGTKVLVVGGPGLFLALEEVGMVPVTSAEDDPAVVVQGLSRTLAWPELAEAAYAIGNGAEFIASNLDSTLPTERGMAPGNGSLVAAVAHATGVRPRATGKPEPEIFHQAAERAGGRRPVMIGDRLDTDIAGARAAGYPSMHVFTGVDGPRELLRAGAHERPTLLAHDLRGLLEPHPAVAPEGDSWRCRDARAQVRDSRLELTENGLTTVLSGADAAAEATISLDGLRALLAAGWTADGLDLTRLTDLHVAPERA
ncbi:HAD-IIA family hydrolase [Pseudactinotalea sp. HY158]|uniref:HAD-IIA family hydrolase n=1 Tax=Pseudactinotalea sp. HY158 TaxID=2654547 RepID=UPI00129CD494|nr:HAD-IIA family hydrolase [Pseudactinotalea sp. HY158]QGH69080.1 HAD-IIA family hydrolase [Pseudactinotalea sp. HY158]